MGCNHLRAADVAEVTVFRLFENKEKLFAAALDWSTENWRIPTSEFEKALDKENLKEAIRCACELYIARTNPSYWRLRLFALLENKQLTPEQQKRVYELPHAIQQRLERAAAEGVTKDSLNAYHAASHLIASLFSMWMISGISGSETRDMQRAVGGYVYGSVFQRPLLQNAIQRILAWEV